MNDYLQARGRNVEVFFGFRLEASLALIAPAAGLFVADVELERDGAGAVVCHLGGEDALLLEVADGLWLNVAQLTARWPVCMSELAERVGEAKVDAFLAEPALVEELRDGVLEEFIVEHKIHADDLILLGERWSSGLAATQVELGSGTRFELELPGGTLTLDYPEPAYRAAHAARENPFQRQIVSCNLQWRGELIDIEPQIPWHDGELLELLVAATSFLDAAPGRVVQFFESVFDKTRGLTVDDSTSGSRGDTLAELLNLYGVALRREGRLDEALTQLERALSLVTGAGNTVEQHLSYNRGYARLQATMKSTQGVGPERDGVRLYTSHFELKQRFREPWEMCRADFERAVELDEGDFLAVEQLRLTDELLALLDVNESTEPRARQPRTTGGADGAPAGAEPESGTPMHWLILAALLLVGFVVFVVFRAGG